MGGAGTEGGAPAAPAVLGPEMGAGAVNTLDASARHPLAPAADVTMQSVGAEGDVTDEVTAAAQAADEEEADTITWQRTVLYTTTLERMQKKLYYDQYFCVSSFVQDLQQIVHNAEAAEVVDGERALKAHQMLNMASILLDQFVEPAFRDECERMAVRVARREAAEQAKEGQEKTQQRETTHSKAGHGNDKDDIAEEEKDQEPPPPRRAASAPEQQHSWAHASHPPRTQPTSSAPTAPGSPRLNGVKRVHELLESEDSAPKRTRLNASLSPVGAVAETVVPAQQLVLSPSLVAEVGDKLGGLDGFSVEELESVRAACFDRLWARRGSWDRDPAARAMLQAVAQAAAARNKRLVRDAAV